MKIALITLIIITIQVNFISSVQDEPEVIIFGGKKIEWTTEAGEIMKPSNQTKKICWGIPTCCTPQSQIGCPCSCPSPIPPCGSSFVFFLSFFLFIFLPNFTNHKQTSMQWMSMHVPITLSDVLYSTVCHRLSLLLPKSYSSLWFFVCFLSLFSIISQK